MASTMMSASAASSTSPASAAPTTTLDVLTTFGFTTPAKVSALSALLRETGGFIAGGAALYWFLGERSPTDQDLDIWIPTQTRRNPAYNEQNNTPVPSTYKAIALRTLPDGSPDPTCYADDAAVVERVAAFLTVMGYSPIPDASGRRWGAERDWNPAGMDIPYHRNPEFQRIVKGIRDYRSAATGGRKIQVIYYYGDTEPLTGFDLDVCQIAVYPTTDGAFTVQLPAGLEEAAVRARHMRITNTSCPMNLGRRLAKYYARGFRVVVEGGRRVLTVEEAVETYGPGEGR